MSTTFKADVRAGLYALMSDFQQSRPDLLDVVLKTRPGAFSDKFTAYLGPINEVLTFGGGAIRDRRLTPTVVIATRLSDVPEEQADAMDLVVDAFIEYASARPHAVNNTTLLQPTSIEAVELDMEGTFYPASVIGFLAIEMTGRYP